MSAIAKPLLRWFENHGRHSLPWRDNPENPYHIWISETMLQQTQVRTVVPYFENFIDKLPDVGALAAAKSDAVLALWAGLGYYARARNLHKSAMIIHRQYDGDFPDNLAGWVALPGVGKSTAGAILATVQNAPFPILDGNVRRVLSRYYEVSGDHRKSAVKNRLWFLAEKNTPSSNCRNYTQAIMDLGALVCTKTKPACAVCPLQSSCAAHKNATIADYPQKIFRPSKPTRRLAWLIFQNRGGRIFLQRRENFGIWRGLFCFIECENKKNTIDRQIRSFDENAKIEKKLPAFRHTLTHLYLNITPYIIRTCRRENFYPPAAPPANIPSPVKKMLENFVLK